VSSDSGILFVCEGREMEIIYALGNDVALVRKLCGRAEVDDGAQARAVAKLFGNLGLDLAQMSASV
jgi:hypothetical protein